MFALSFASAILLGASAVSAFPTHRQVTGCSLANATPSFPAGQTALTQQASAPSFIALGAGVQNYTCNATSGAFVSTGAVAELFDISCLYNTPEFSNISSDAFKAWSAAPASITTQDVIAKLANGRVPVPEAVLGEHYFVVPSPGAAIAPKWDFTSHKYAGNPNAFVIGAKDATLAAASPTTDVPWLQLHGVSGKLATVIYRLDTKGGQPPASCAAGSADMSVKYTAVYWLYGTSV